MTVIIGIDPHKRLHGACAIDETEREVAQLQVTAGECQLEELLQWAAPFATRRWAIESAGGLGYLLAQQLISVGECVVDVPATLASRSGRWVRAVRTRTTRTTRERLRSRRYAHRPSRR